MFTGLVRTTGTIVGCQDRDQTRRLVIAGDLSPADVELGASVSCNGVCLTVVAAEAGRFSVDAAFETLDKTTLGSWAPQTRVNLEPSLRVGDAMGGHFVTGHVDGVGRLRQVALRGAARALWFDLPPAWIHLCAPKGSVTLDGVSLTINEVDDRGLMVALVPHTLAVTTLGGLSPGDEVNFEVDILARYVARILAATGEMTGRSVTWQTLADAGWVDANLTKAPGKPEGAP